MPSENVEKTAITHCLIITFIKMDSFYVAERIFLVESLDLEQIATRLSAKITMRPP